MSDQYEEIHIIDIVNNETHDAKTNDKIKYLYGDLNFISLEENEFDLIIAKSILHHIINLEHLLFQANKALKNNGKLVVYEYIGENKQQWQTQKADFLTSSLRSKFKDIEELLPIKPAPLTNLVPFESIRSFDILDVIHKIFPQDNRLMEETWDFFRYTFQNHLFHCGWKDKLDQKKQKKIIDFIDELELKMKNASSEYPPANLFGIYAKCH
jgi:ubiquinone/menaquinone biosynthesis C-methylase UbiE